VLNESLQLANNTIKWTLVTMHFIIMRLLGCCFCTPRIRQTYGKDVGSSTRKRHGGILRMPCVVISSWVSRPNPTNEMAVFCRNKQRNQNDAQGSFVHPAYRKVVSGFGKADVHYAAVCQRLSDWFCKSFHWLNRAYFPATKQTVQVFHMFPRSEIPPLLVARQSKGVYDDHEQ
jgi:hypothetical protein